MTDITPDGGPTQLDRLLREVRSHEFDVIVHDAIESLDQSLQPVALMVMEGMTQNEISRALQCSRRTVVRKFDLVKRLLRAIFE